MNLFENDTADDERIVDELLKELNGENYNLTNMADLSGDNGSSELYAYYVGKAEGYEESAELVKEYAKRDGDET